MHTFEHKRADGCKTFIRHEGDFSGNVTVLVPSEVGSPALHHKTHMAELTIPYEAIRALVLENLRREAIAELENIDGEVLWERLKQAERGL